MHCGRKGRGRMLGKWPPQGSNSCILWKILSPSQNSGAVGDEHSLRKRFTWQRCTSASMLGRWASTLSPCLLCLSFAPLAYLPSVSCFCPHFTSCHVLGYFFSLPDQVQTIFSMIHCGRNLLRPTSFPRRGSNDWETRYTLFGRFGSKRLREYYFRWGWRVLKTRLL